MKHGFSGDCFSDQCLRNQHFIGSRIIQVPAKCLERALFDSLYLENRLSDGAKKMQSLNMIKNGADAGLRFEHTFILSVRMCEKKGGKKIIFVSSHNDSIDEAYNETMTFAIENNYVSTWNKRFTC